MLTGRCRQAQYHNGVAAPAFNIFVVVEGRQGLSFEQYAQHTFQGRREFFNRHVGKYRV